MDLLLYLSQTETNGNVKKNFIIPLRREIKFVQMKDHALIQGRTIAYYEDYIDNPLRIVYKTSEPTSISTETYIKHSWVNEIHLSFHSNFKIQSITV